jgi:hypothetical protein
MSENWLCGCGEAFNRCRFWNDVLDDASLRPSQIDLGELQHSERSLLRLRNSARALGWSTARLRGKHSLYLGAVERLYASIAHVSGAEAIVDTSKNPVYGALLATMDKIDLRVIHLVRDPRAAAHSWLNPKLSLDRAPGASMDRLGAAKSAFLWSWWNGLTETLLPADGSPPVVRARYESIVSAPASTLRHLRDRVLPEHSDRPLSIQGSLVSLVPAHTISGNPDRTITGPVAIKADERWRAGLSKPRQGVVLAIAGIEMLHYGYRWSRR